MKTVKGFLCRPTVLLLAGTLLLCLAGCDLQKDPEESHETKPVIVTEETQIATTAETTVPTEAVAAETEEHYYPERIADAILIEGEPEKLFLNLFDGGNYIVYIIEDMWTLETDLMDGYLRDRWVCSFNDMIDFQVISLGPMPPQEASAYIREKKSGYQFDETNPLDLSGMDMQRSYFMNGQIFSDEKNTFAVFAEFPMEAGDGFSGRTWKMIKSFEIP